MSAVTADEVFERSLRALEARRRAEVAG